MLPIGSCSLAELRALVQTLKRRPSLSQLAWYPPVYPRGGGGAFEHPWGDEGVAAISELGAQLRTLELSDRYIRIRAVGVATVARGLPNLVELSLDGCGPGTEGFAAIATMPHLRFLNVSKTTVDDEGAQALARGCPALEGLRVSSGYLGDAGAIALASLPRLRHSVLRTRAVGDEGIIALAACPTLEYLQIRSKFGRRGALALYRAVASRVELWVDAGGREVALARSGGTKPLSDWLEEAHEIALQRHWAAWEARWTVLLCRQRAIALGVRGALAVLPIVAWRRVLEFWSP